jgi:SnoaL-like domain
MSAEEVVRAFFDCYTSGRPEDFDQVVAADYVDYGHTPPGHGPGGARDDYEHAIGLAGGVITYEIDALVTDGDAGGDTVAAVWTGTMPNGSQYRGLSLYTASGGLLRSTRHTLIGDRPT